LRVQSTKRTRKELKLQDWEGSEFEGPGNHLQLSPPIQREKKKSMGYQNDYEREAEKGQKKGRGLTCSFSQFRE